MLKTRQNNLPGKINKFKVYSLKAYSYTIYLLFLYVNHESSSKDI